MSRPSFSQLMREVETWFHLRACTEGLTPELKGDMADEFVKEAMKYYSEAEVVQWLDSVGMRPKEKVKGKKGERIFLGDGTYILNGVRFGEPRKERIVEKLSFPEMVKEKGELERRIERVGEKEEELKSRGKIILSN